MNENQEFQVGGIVAFFKEHPVLVITLSILLCSALGYWREYTLMQEFGINIVVFAEADDFLLAAFKSPIIFLVTFPMFATAIAFVWLQIRRFSRINADLRYMEVKLRDRYEGKGLASSDLERIVEREKRRYRLEHGVAKNKGLIGLSLTAMIFGGVASLFMLVHFENENTLNNIKTSPDYYTVVDLRTNRSLLPDDNKQLVLITATEKYIFLYRHMSNGHGETYILPSASITSIVQIPVAQDYIRDAKPLSKNIENIKVEFNDAALSGIYRGLESINIKLDNFKNMSFTYLTSASVNFREGPGREFPIMYVLPEGAEIEYIGSDDIWSYVNETNSGKKGWVHTRYIEPFINKPNNNIQGIPALTRLHP